jgi:hypothetical protein
MSRRSFSVLRTVGKTLVLPSGPSGSLSQGHDACGQVPRILLANSIEGRGRRASHEAAAPSFASARFTRSKPTVERIRRRPYPNGSVGFGHQNRRPLNDFTPVGREFSSQHWSLPSHLGSATAPTSAQSNPQFRTVFCKAREGLLGSCGEGISTSVIRFCVLLAENFLLVRVDPLFMRVRRHFQDNRTSKPFLVPAMPG